MTKEERIEFEESGVTVSKIGNCQGKNIFGCKNYASLRPVIIGSKEIWLCGSCIAKIKGRMTPERRKHIRFL